jgi:hypothetical protein
MTEKVSTMSMQSVCFACPKCKSPLRSEGNTLYCSMCNSSYPIVDGIPAFIPGSSPPGAKFFNLLAPLYESRLWMRFFLNLVGAGGTSVRSITSFHV